MENFTLENDNSPNIEFEGEEIGSGSTLRYNRDATRWVVFKLFKTKGGKFVAQTIGRSQWDGEVDRYECRVCSTADEVKAFFGFSDAAKEVYAEAGIDSTVKVA